MPKDLTVPVENKATALQALGDTAARASSAVEGICATTAVGQRTFHLLVSDDKVDEIRETLKAAGLNPGVERQVLVVPLEGPAGIGNATAALGRQGVGIDLAYLATGDRLVLGVDDIDAATSALRGIGS